jgi:ABC-2 type transport system ATP-binding protein
MSNEALIQVDRVDKVFFTHHVLQKNPDTDQRKLYERRRVHAVNNIDFEINKGEVFGLLGPNGAGKTTTVKMICGLVRPDTGDVTVAGESINKNRKQVLRRLGVVLEGTRTVIWPLTPLENLAYFGNLKDVKGPVLKKRSRELLEFIGLKDKMNVQVRRLSRGEKQKLAICIALIADPPIILLDEPTTGLDVQSSRAIREKIHEMTRTQGKSVLITTHDMNVAQLVCDRIGIIDKGKLVACQETPELIDVFSDQTYVFQLDRLPANGLLDGVPGVNGTTYSDDEDGPKVVVQIEEEAGQRSEALYGTMAAFRQEGIVLRSVTQQQQTLENVFVRITTSTV